MNLEEKRKYTASIAFKLMLMFLATMAGIGILVLFETVIRSINL